MNRKKKKKKKKKPTPSQDVFAIYQRMKKTWGKVTYLLGFSTPFLLRWLCVSIL